MFSINSIRARRSAAAVTIVGTLAVGGLLSVAVAPAAEAASPTIVVSTSAQLSSALRAVVPGQSIKLADGLYTGRFEANVAGKSGKPITIWGSRKAVLTTGTTKSGYALHVTAVNYRIKGFSVTNAMKGIVLDNSSKSQVIGVDVGKIGQEAIHVRSNSVSVVVKDSLVHDTGLLDAGFGEGIYVGSANSNWEGGTADRSDAVLVQGNTISNTAAEGIDIKEGTTGGRILNNVFDNAGYSGANSADSWVDVKGNNYVLTGNSGNHALLDAFQVHSVLSGWGKGNTFAGGNITGDVPGYEVQIPSSATGNTVLCKSSSADKGLTNITCS